MPVFLSISTILTQSISGLTQMSMLVFFLAVPKTFTLECVQGSEVRASRVYETSNFHSVELDGSFDLVITQGPTHKVWARGDEKILEHLDFSVESGFLTASLGPGCFFMYDMVVFVETPHLRRAMISGSGDIALGGFQSQLYPNYVFDELSARVEGSGTISLKEMAGIDLYEVIVNGSGNVDFLEPMALAERLSIQINGSGDVDARSLASGQVKIVINGSGDVDAHVLGGLEVDVNGSGDVRYLGEPEMVDTNVHGSGTVSRY